MNTQTEALRLALEYITQSGFQTGINEVITAIREALAEPEMAPAFRSSHAYTVGFQDGKAQALAEQPAQRCPLCDYQHGHAIGCENNPVDIALNKMAENERELGLDYMEPAPATELRKQQEPVAVVKALPMGHNQTDMHYAECQHLPVGTLLYTSPPASKPWVGLTEYERADVYKSIPAKEFCVDAVGIAIEAKLREKNA